MTEWVIDVGDLTKRFGNKTVVDKLTLRVASGEIYGFLGPNGAGKTTSIRMMCGLLTPDSGSGRTLGHDVVHEASAIKCKVGYMTQHFGLYHDLSIRENLDFIARIYRLPDRNDRIDATLTRLGLTERQRQLAGSLSGGWKQRLSLAACLLHEPRLLLLDEPTAGVDPKARREFWDEIHQLASSGITVLVSTHYMDEAERCHRLGYIAYGKLLATGTPETLVSDAQLHTWHIRGPGLQGIADQLKNSAAVQQITRYGNALHVSGSDQKALQCVIETLNRLPELELTPGTPSLEDVFIHLMHRYSPDHEH